MKLSPSELKIKKRAKTFYFASLFFSKKKQEDISILYTFCRYIDDLGDNPLIKKTTAKEHIDLIKNDIINGDSNIPIIKDFLILMRKYNINMSTPLHLISGVSSDLSKVRIKTYKELMIYSYKVAGTVGLMMCKLMEINDRELNKKGILLGIAMQLTNIIRDINEDLQNDRIYFPIQLLSFKFSKIDEIKKNKNLKKKFSNDLFSLIENSNKIYSTSWLGIKKLPLKYRIPISIASKLYQEIGVKIMKNASCIWEKRIFIAKLSKIILSLETILKIFFDSESQEYPKIEKEIFSILTKFDNRFYD